MIGRSLYSDFNCKGTRRPKLRQLPMIVSVVMFALSAGLVAMSFQRSETLQTTVTRTSRL